RRATDVEDRFMALHAEVFAFGGEEAAFAPVDPRAFDVRDLSLLDRTLDRTVELFRRGLQAFEHLVPVRNDEGRRGHPNLPSGLCGRSNWQLEKMPGDPGKARWANRKKATPQE